MQHRGGGKSQLLIKKRRVGSSKSLRKPFKVKVRSFSLYSVACQLCKARIHYKHATPVRFPSLVYGCV